MLKFDKPLIMGVLNVTPDSFSDAGEFFDKDKAIKHAKQMVQEGADIIDIGGESTRPGSDPVSEEEEFSRVIPVIEELAKLDITISIDTSKPKIAEEAIKAGASIINDVTGLQSKDMRDVVKQYNVPAIIMHMKGQPKNMQQQPDYDDVVQDIYDFFEKQIKIVEEEGVNVPIILDPGIGFGKTVEHNLKILKELARFKELGKPLLVGASRKSFIGKLTGAEVGDRLAGSIAAAVIAVMNGASIVRVHDVKETKQALEIIQNVVNV